MKHIRMKAAVLQYIKKGIYMNEDLRVIVSIIVPVYKVEKYLSACIDSLLRQTYPYLQIILIDDGSPDRCPAICEDYAEKDERIQVVHQQNAGLSAARNTGMQVSYGKYILFVDSDDTILPMACEELVRGAEAYSAEIVAANSCWINEIDVQTKTHWDVCWYEIEAKVVSGREFLLGQLEHGCYMSAVWTNLYQREFLMKNMLFFVPDIFREDEEWTPRVFALAQRVTQIKSAFYQYKLRNQSIMRDDSLAVKRQKDFVEIIAPSVSNALQCIDHNLWLSVMKNLFYKFMGCSYSMRAYYSKHKSELMLPFWNEILLDRKARFWLRLAQIDFYLFTMIWNIRGWLKTKLG